MPWIEGCRTLGSLIRLSDGVRDWCRQLFGAINAYHCHYALSVLIGSEPTHPRALEKALQQVQETGHPGTLALHPRAAHLVSIKSTMQRDELSFGPTGVAYACFRGTVRLASR